MRIGNEEYARANRSFGLTTLRNRHADGLGRRGCVCAFAARAARSTRSRSTIRASPASSGAARRCPARSCSSTSTTTARSTPSARPTSTTTCATSSGADFTAKDFRTWHGTAHALELWIGQGAEPERRPSAKALLAEVAARLGNTVAVCKKSYVHPRVLEVLASAPDAALLARLETVAARSGLTAAERRLGAFLARR